MENVNLVRNYSGFTQLSGKPSIPSGKEPIVEKKISDPSSCYPKGERYPIPSFFEYRFKGREYDPL